MEFPKSVPSAGLVDGKFVDEDALTGAPGSLIPSAWGNAITLEVLHVIEAAGLVPDEEDNAQLIAAIRLLGKAVVLNATGAANAYAAVNTPAMSVLPATGYLQKVKIANANTAASTYAPDGLAAKPIYGLGLQPLQGGELSAGVAVLMYLVQGSVNGGNGAWILIESLGGSAQVAPATKSLHAINAGQLQTQALTAFTSAGVAPALTLTPVPAVAAYAANQRFRVKFGAASSGNDTLNISGLGAKSLKQYDSRGAKVAAIFVAGQLTDVEYDGVDIVVLDPLPAVAGNLVGITGASKKLAGSATGTSAVVSVTADEVIAKNSANSYVTLRGINIAPSFGNPVGANGLDAGVVAASTHYYVWVIWNGATIAGLLSLSATAPTLPGGYTHCALVSWVLTDSTANKYPLSFTQAGRIFQPKVTASTNLPGLQLMASGLVGSTSIPTMGAVAVGGFVPPIASRICVIPILTNATNAIIVAPNPAYGRALAAANPPPIQEFSNSGGGAFNTPKWLSLESGNIWWATNGASNYLYYFGCEINL